MKTPINILLLLSALYLGCGGGAKKTASYKLQEDVLEKFDLPELYWSEDTFQYYLGKDLARMDTLLFKKYGHLGSRELFELANKDYLPNPYTKRRYSDSTDGACQLYLIAIKNGDRKEALRLMAYLVIKTTNSGKEGFIPSCNCGKENLYKAYVYLMKCLQLDYALVKGSFDTYVLSSGSDGILFPEESGSKLEKFERRVAILERIYIKGDSIGSSICDYPLYRLYTDGYLLRHSMLGQSYHSGYASPVKAMIYFLKGLENRDPGILFEYASKLEDGEGRFDAMVSCYKRAKEIGAPHESDAEKFLEQHHKSKWEQYKKENNIVDRNYSSGSYLLNQIID